MVERGPQLTTPAQISDGEFAGALRIGSQNELEAYWYVPANEIVLTADKATAPDAVERYRLSAETVGEYVHRTEREGAVWSLNRLGEFLRNVASFGNVRILTLRQEEAYALCRISGLDHESAGELLGISERLLRTHLSTAQKRSPARSILSKRSTNTSSEAIKTASVACVRLSVLTSLFMISETIY